MSRIVEFEGKRYPRFWEPVHISLSEAMARMGAKSYHTNCKVDEYTDRVGVAIHANVTDVPEGVEVHGIQAERIHGYDRVQQPAVFIVRKCDINEWLTRQGRPNAMMQTRALRKKPTLPLKRN